MDSQLFERLTQLARDWALSQEQFILARGIPLDTRASTDAERVGVRKITSVKVLVVDRIPMPEHPELMEAARRTQIITPSSRAITMGYGIMVRADSWSDRELIVHQLVHVAQCERCGGIEPYLQQYFSDRVSTVFGLGAFEHEARSVAREICNGSHGVTNRS